MQLHTASPCRWLWSSDRSHCFISTACVASPALLKYLRFASAYRRFRRRAPCGRVIRRRSGKIGKASDMGRVSSSSCLLPRSFRGRRLSAPHLGFASRKGLPPRTQSIFAQTQSKVNDTLRISTHGRKTLHEQPSDRTAVVLSKKAAISARCTCPSAITSETVRLRQTERRGAHRHCFGGLPSATYARKGGFTPVDTFNHKPIFLSSMMKPNFQKDALCDFNAHRKGERVSTCRAKAQVDTHPIQIHSNTKWRKCQKKKIPWPKSQGRTRRQMDMRYFSTLPLQALRPHISVGCLWGCCTPAENI